MKWVSFGVPLSKHATCNSISARGLLEEGEGKRERPCWSGDMRQADSQTVRQGKKGGRRGARGKRRKRKKEGKEEAKRGARGKRDESELCSRGHL